MAADQPSCILAAGLSGADLEPGQPPAVLIKGGYITALGQEALDSGAPVEDLGHLWLTHAPIDTHVHLRLGGNTAVNLQRYQQGGVCVVRDLGHSPAADVPGNPGQGWPLVIASGPGLGAKGPGSSWLAEGLAGPDEMAQAVKSRIAAGARVIKLFASGLLDFEQPGNVLHGHALSLNEMRAAVQTAHAAGLTVAAHVSGSEGVRRAVEAGVDSIEHGFFMDRPTMQLLGDQSVFWAPTLAAVQAHIQDPEKRHAEHIKNNLAKIAESQIQAMLAGEELGIRLVVGSDAGSYGMEHGNGLYTEVQAWLNAGLKPYTVYKGVTEHAAKVLNTVSLMGRIKEGVKALLLGVPGNPAENPLIMINASWNSQA